MNFKNLIVACLFLSIGNQHVFAKIENDKVDFISIFPKDKLIAIEKATLTRGNTNGDESVSNTLDKDHSKIYGSSETLLGDSVIIDYTLKDAPALINSIQLIQRQDGNISSHFEAGSIWYQTAKSSKWELLKVFKVNRGSNLSVCVKIVKPTKIRVCLKQLSVGGAISLAEAEFYELGDIDDFKKDARFFEDDVFSKLKPKTTKKDLKKISSPIIRFLAKRLLDNNYSSEFRVRTYQGQRTPWVISRELQFGSQSHYDNPTGIFFAANEKYAVYLNKGTDVPVNLRITDFRKDGGSQSVILKEGMNVFTSKVSGSGFIQYYTDGKETLPGVKIHFILGNEVGFWDTRSGHTNADWKRLLDMSSKCYNELNHLGGFFTTCGEYSQLLNTVDAFKEWCPTDIERLMARHDSILLLSYDLMGLSKHNAIPKNRKLNIRTWGGMPNWNGSSANYPNEEKGMLDADNIHWGVFAHELGHGNQIRHMSMVGWTEVSNNIYSLYVNHMMGNKTYFLEHIPLWRTQEETNAEPALAGERFNSFLNETHIAKKPYLTHLGWDYKNGDIYKGKYIHTDHFVKLAPLWQLTIYFMLAGGEDHRPHFWADVHWAAIQDDRTDLSQGKRYVNFMKRCMTSANCNLNEYFINMGLLRVISHYIADYGPDLVEITQADYDEVIAYGNTLPSPKSPVVSYISINSLYAFKNKLEVTGIFGLGVSDYASKGCKRKKIDHSVWKNVVVFEIYAGDELIDISMVGTGDASNMFTCVRYPDNATRIEAVSFNGKRTLVYNKH